MPLEKDIQNRIYEYCNNDLNDNDYCDKLFDFILDERLKEKIIRKYKAIRFSYKLFEGIAAKDELLEFEVQHQLIAYSAIYEAMLTYVLEKYYHENLTNGRHDVSFSEKCKIAESYGLLKSYKNKENEYIDIKDELQQIYRMRNQIHIYAEIRNNRQYNLDMSKKAYWRMEVITVQIKKQLSIDNKYNYMTSNEVQ